MSGQTLGRMIASLRKERGMTQLELAERMGVTDKAVSKWERDLSCPSVETLPKLAELFRVSVDELMQVQSQTPPEAGCTERGEITVLALRAVALAMGVIYTMFLALGHKASVRKSNLDATGKDPECFREVVLNSWIARGMEVALIALLVTAMGGALAAFIKNAGVANAVAETVVQFSIPGIIIPILIAALIHVITGSNALGVMTAAALVEPMLGALGISPLAAFLACGTGALMFKHANSSGFWVTVTMSNMDIRQGIRAVGGGSTVAGVTGAAITVILHFAGII